MKYKVGDKLYFNRYGEYQECEVKNVLESTKRYRVKYKYLSYNGENFGNDLLNENKLFLSINDCIDSEIKALNTKIDYMRVDINKLLLKRTV